MISPARLVAFDVLRRVESESAYAADLLASLASDLSSQDAGLAEELVFGVLRRQAELDFLITRQTGRPMARLDPEVRIALRMGVYQVVHLDRIPAYAAVGESVELVKRARKKSAAGLVNAILRKTSRDPVQPPERATELSMPGWLLDSWDRQFGVEIATGIARAALQKPETYVRLPEKREGLVLEPTEVAGGFRVLEGSAKSLRIQDIGSQSIVPLLDLQPGQTFLDLCAAPGNKTAHAMEFGVDAIACDFHLHRLRNVTGCVRVVLDARAPLPFRRKFDRVLVDAPCSGTGTLSRNPEIKWRLTAGDIQALQAKQVEILSQAVTTVAPGGKLVYSTCSLERQENEDVVQAVEERMAGRLKVLATRRRTPGIEPGDGFFAAVMTVL